MAYTINKTDGSVVTTITDGTVDNTTSVQLFGKSFSGFGEGLNENLVKLLENSAGTSAPSSPLKGELWFDASTNQLKVYDGSNFKPQAAAGHSLGEFSALSACKAISFEEGLKLVSIRANAMQAACEKNPGSMAAILGVNDSIIESVCSNIKEIIQPANYNCPGQLVISGETNAVKTACEELTKLGAKRAIILPVNGAFHSELMSSAAEELEHAINQTEFNNPICPIYQNYNAKPETNKNSIKKNLLLQLTNPVLWTQSINRMIKDGYNNFFELGPGNTLQGLIRKIDSEVATEKLEI